MVTGLPVTVCFVTFIPEPLWQTISSSIPILCVDFVPVNPDGLVGVILRKGPYGEVWCHLGGRVNFGETLDEALLRHLEDALTGSVASLPDLSRPLGVFQWFPGDIHPEVVGRDERKHAVSLAYRVPLLRVGEPSGEALEVAWVAPSALPAPLWPGTRELYERVAGS